MLVTDDVLLSVSQDRPIYAWVWAAVPSGRKAAIFGDYVRRPLSSHITPRSSLHTTGFTLLAARCSLIANR